MVSYLGTWFIKPTPEACMEPETGQPGLILFISYQGLLLLGQAPIAVHT